MRLANIKDVDLYFKWANDALVRKFSFTQDLIQYNNHVKWFESKINDENYRFYIFENENKEPVGQVRINKDTKETIIGISIDEKYRGMNYGIKMINLTCESYLSIFPSTEINAYIKETNVASINLFKKAGFTKIEELDFEGCKSLKFKKK
jgi:RimJ/RimL family protein N-acetyltransferase